ncbi:MAG: hypothetical protein WBI04_04695 [Trichlorobacter sp.]
MAFHHQPALFERHNRTRPCGRNLQQLWQTHQRQLTTRINPVEFLVLQAREKPRSC